MYLTRQSERNKLVVVVVVVCAVSFYVAETPKASIKDQDPPITHNTFWHCRVRFCCTTILEIAVYIGKRRAQGLFL